VQSPNLKYRDKPNRLGQAGELDVTFDARNSYLCVLFRQNRCKYGVKNRALQQPVCLRETVDFLGLLVSVEDYAYPPKVPGGTATRCSTPAGETLVVAYHAVVVRRCREHPDMGGSAQSQPSPN
jgi:hypothetical protein